MQATQSVSLPFSLGEIMKFWKFYGSYKKSLVLVIGGALLAAGLEIVFPMIVRHMLSVVLPARDIGELWREGAFLFMLYCVFLQFCIDTILFILLQRFGM